MIQDLNDELTYGVDNVAWSNPDANISKHFKVSDALWLHRWNRLATEEDGLTSEVCGWLIETFEILDRIQDQVRSKIIVHSCYRPLKYNQLIGGARKSYHMQGRAVDFSTDMDYDGDRDGRDCDQIKELLKPQLAKLGIRMEDNGQGAGWIHIDTANVWALGNRFFKP